MFVLNALLFLSVSTCGQVSGSEQHDELAATAYIDGMHGFSIRPPKGWQLSRRQVPEKHGVTLLQMVGRWGPNRIQEIVLRELPTARDVTMGEILKKLHEDLALEYSNIEMLSQQVQEIAGRPGGVLAATYWRGGFLWLRLEAVIKVRARRHYVLLYNGPAEARKRSEPLFHLVLASLRLLKPHLSRAELDEALKAGATMLAGIGAENLRKAVVPEQLFKFVLDGKTVGFVQIRQDVTTMKDRSGVRIREGGWMFEPDGRLRRVQANMFVSEDLREGNWKTSVTTLIPARGAQPAYLENAMEEGLYQQDALLTSQAYHLSDPVTENPPLRVPEAFVSLAVVRMLPRLVGDLSKPRRLAFAQFDHQRVGMVIRIVELKGAGDLPTGVTRGKVYRIEEREGPTGEPSNVYVDEAGQVLLVKSGKLTMVPASAEALERPFESRVAAAKREMARLEKEYEEQERRFMPRHRSKDKVRP